MVPARPADDIALLVVRTLLLDPARTARWKVSSDPAAVAPVRTACGRQLRTWGLEEIAFTTELMLSELITNAIHYAAQPVTVRLIHDRSLICEVADGSSASPHLRGQPPPTRAAAGCSSSPSSRSAGGPATPLQAKSSGPNSRFTTRPRNPAGTWCDLLLDQWTDETL
jgi:hypothetical protein